MSKVIIIAAVVLVVLALAGLVAFKFILSGVGPVTLTYWGLWEPASVYQTVIADYQKLHPNVTVKYQMMSPLGYRDRLMTALAQDGGPDIVRIHNTWLPMLVNNLQPVPASAYSTTEFKSTFYPVASLDLTSGNTIWAVPLEIDSLIMYVNQDLLNASGVTSIPATWEDFTPAATKMTVRDNNGKIQTAGTALGVTGNVDSWQDIVGLMMLQAGVDLNNQSNSQAAQEALAFYTGFSTADRDWDETLDPSTLAFANGKVGFYFGSSWRFFDIKNINGSLNFKVAPVPQLTGGKTVNYASYWAEAISKKSAHGKEAGDFLKFISSKDELTKLYSAEAALRGFGEPYSRVDMGSLLTNDPVAGVVISEAPTAGSWYLAGATNDGDTGINAKIGKYYLDAINTVVGGGDPKSALDTVASGVAQVLSTYGVGGAVSTQVNR